MQNTNPKLTFLSIKTIHKEYFPMFSLKTVRNMIINNVPYCKLGNRILIRQCEFEKYLSSLNLSLIKEE